ncbi:MAG: tripartite tricarboxylate transporter substrate binding protein [Pseudomonadales bacterium]
MKKIIKLLSVAALIGAPLAPLTTLAADYPNRPVKFVVPWPPGDLEDVLTRLIAEQMAADTGKPASVVNKPGGGGVIGAADVARAPANGLTIGSFVADIVTTHLHAGNAPYQRDSFEPVGIFLDYPFVLAARADAPYNNIAELAAHSKGNPVALGHFGYQALPTAITFKAAAQEKITFSSDAAFDSLDCSTLANGDADVINTTTQLILACLKSGEAKLIAAITKDRISIAPQTPTLYEQTGIAQTTWNGLFVKRGTAPGIKSRIAQIAQKTMQSQRAIDISKTTGAGVFWIGGEEAKALVERDYAASAKLLDFMKE